MRALSRLGSTLWILSSLSLLTGVAGCGDDDQPANPDARPPDTTDAGSGEADAGPAAGPARNGRLAVTELRILNEDPNTASNVWSGAFTTIAFENLADWMRDNVETGGTSLNSCAYTIIGEGGQAAPLADEGVLELTGTGHNFDRDGDGMEDPITCTASTPGNNYVCVVDTGEHAVGSTVAPGQLPGTTNYNFAGVDFTGVPVRRHVSARRRVPGRGQ